MARVNKRLGARYSNGGLGITGADLAGKMRFWTSKALTWLLLGLLSYTAKGKIINVTTNDNYTKIESAVAGDQVVIAPGTYAFRVYLTAEITNRLWRIRDSALDLGAFESSTTTNLRFGPYDPFPSPLLYIRRTGTSAVVSWPLYAQDFQLLGSSLTVPWAWNLVSGTSTTNLTGVSSDMGVDASGRLFRLRR